MLPFPVNIQANENRIWKFSRDKPNFTSRVTCNKQNHGLSQHMFPVMFLVIVNLIQTPDRDENPNTYHLI